MLFCKVENNISKQNLIVLFQHESSIKTRN